MNDYQALIDRLADSEPKCGYTNLAQFELSDADVAIVIQHEPDIIADAFVPTTGYIESNIRWALNNSIDRTRANATLGEMVRVIVRVEAKKLVLIDVQDECNRRTQVRHLRSAAKRGDVGAAMAARGEV
jgi:hypothetical protein